MGNLIYDGNSKEVELGGKTIAEVREMYGSELDIPARTRVKVNGKWLKRNQEAKTVLSSGDELSFMMKSFKPLAIVGAFILALVITGTVFAATQTTTTTTITIGGGSTDYCEITSNTTDSPTYTLLGKFRGVIDEGSLFDVTPDSNYTGDLVLNIVINNVDSLQNDYSSWMMRLQVTDSANVTRDTQGLTEIITLDKPDASFEIEAANVTASGGTVYIHCDGGSYKTYGSGWLSAEDPVIYAQVVQAGAH